jgi:hypothetical protein
VTFPAHALLIVEERFREQEAEGVRMPKGLELDELCPANPDGGCAQHALQGDAVAQRARLVVPVGPEGDVQR